MSPVTHRPRRRASTVITAAWAVCLFAGCSPDAPPEPPIVLALPDTDAALLEPPAHVPDAGVPVEPEVFDLCDPGIPRIEVRADGSDRWHARGVLVGGTASLAEGGCGGRGGPELVARFDPPRDGLYAIAAVGGPDFAPVIHVRRTCAALDSERACRAPESPSVTNLLHVEARAGERLWIFADARGGGLDGSEALVKLEIARADGHVAPTIADARLVGAGGAYLSARLHDPNGDIESVTATWMDAQGRALRAPSTLGAAGARDGQWLGRWSASIEASFDRIPDAATHIRLDVVDRSGLAGWSRVELSAPPTVGTGGGCDPAAVFDRCAQGSSCVTLDGRSVCAVDDRPQLVDLEATDRGHYIALRLAITAPRVPIERIRVELADAAGVPVSHPWDVAVDWPAGRPADVLVSSRWWPVVLESPVLAVVQVFDLDGRASARRAVPIRRAVVVERGERCDPERPSMRCAGQLRCRALADDWRCRPPPPITLHRQYSWLRLSPDRSAYALETALFDGEGDPVDPTVRFAVDGHPTGPAHVLSRARGACRGDRCTYSELGELPEAVRAAMLDQPVGALTLLIDATRPNDPPNIIELVAGPAIEVAEGRGCHPDDATRVCAEGLACGAWGQPAYTCRSYTAPALLDAEAFLDRDGRTLAVHARGVDAGFDEGDFEVVLTDAAGQVLPLGTGLSAHRLSLLLDRGSDVLDFWQSWPIVSESDIEQIHRVERVRVRLLDPVGPPSDWVDVPAQAVPTGAAGERCDWAGHFVHCAEAHVCGHRDPFDHDDWPVCVPEVACPAEWPMTEVAAAADGGWWAEGDLTEGRPYVRRAPGDVHGLHVFRAPADGDYSFRIEGEGHPRLDLRTGCGVASEAYRVAHAGSAGHVLSLAAGDDVIVVASGRAGAAGRYTVRVDAHRPPVIDDVRVWSPNGRDFAIELRWPSDGPTPRSVSLASVDDSGASRWLDFGSVEALGGADGWSMGRARVLHPLPGEPVDWVEVVGRDAYGAPTRPHGVRVQRPEPVEAGAPCDRIGTRVVCAEGTACPDAASGLDAVCRPLPIECPADWPVRDVNGHPRGDGWVVFGDAGEVVAGPSSACLGSPDAAAVHRFVAPHAGAYRITARGALLVDLRRRCAVAEPMCGFDAPGNRPIVDLAAGEALYLLLAGPGNGSPGQHILAVDPT